MSGDDMDENVIKYLERLQSSLERRLDRIDDVLKDHGQKIEDIRVQTTRTNGRVDTLEKTYINLSKTEDEIRSRVVNVEQKLTQPTSTDAEQNSKLTECKQNITELYGLIRGLEARLIQPTTPDNENAKNISECRKDISELYTLVRDTEKTAASIAASLKTLEDTLKTFINSTLEVRKDITDRLASLETSRYKMMAAIAAIAAASGSIGSVVTKMLGQ